MDDTTSKVREVVSRRYGAIAQSQGQASCCGPVDSAASCCSGEGAAASCSPVDQMYNAELLDGLPEDVTGLSLGCGDPVTIAGLAPGETVLDLGSGGGIDCFMAARQVGPTGYVIGVDMTPEMLAKAEANKAKLGVENVEFRHGYIEALPVEDNTIDVIMSNCVINLSPDKPAVFREAFRVLKPGGRVSISDIVTDGEFGPELRAQLDRWAECVTGAIPADAYITMMREAGFVDVAVVDKADAEALIPREPGMPRIFSARIVGRKPVEREAAD